MDLERCEDDLMLQRFLDEELTPDSAEIVFHHIEKCADCRGRIQNLKIIKAFCREELGREDEFEAEFTQTSLLNVKARLDKQRPVSKPSITRTFGRITALFNRLRLRIADLSLVLRWRLVALPATLLVFAGLIAWFAISPSSSISANEILSESERLTAIWEKQPGKVLHWSYEELVNNRGLPDSKTYSFHWQDNTGSGFVRLNRRYDENGVLTWASWMRADGSQIVYNRFPEETIKMTPTTETLRAYASGLDEKSRQVLEKYIGLRSTPAQIEPENNWQVKQLILYKPLARGNVQIIQNADEGKVFRIRGVSFEGQDNSIRVEDEADFAADTFIRNRIRSVRYYPDGTTKSYTAELKSYQETSIEDFNAHDLSAEMRQVKRIIQVTPEEVLKQSSGSKKGGINSKLNN